MSSGTQVASAVDIDLSVADSSLVLTITDDGSARWVRRDGQPQYARTRPSGRGNFERDSMPGRGTRCVLRVPLVVTPIAPVDEPHRPLPDDDNLPAVGVDAGEAPSRGETRR